MPAAAELVILLSVGTFQATLPQIPKATSPVFQDTAQGVQIFMSWLKGALPEPGFNQPPTRVCVVGAVPFTPEAAPYVVRPLWESRPPFRRLEPYSATFHYVELAPGAKAPPARTLRDAMKICAEAWKRKP